jgi:hypothetical protein
VGALKPGSLGHSCHGPAFAGKMMLKVQALKGIARIAQRLIKR